MVRYPLTSRATTIECPVHRVSVALGTDGRLTSTCPRCRREARIGKRRLQRRRRLALEAV
jgi:hypothetical protein